MATEQPALLLDRVLQVLQPLVRLLVRHGVTYPHLAAALKRLFLQAAQHELARQRMPATDSALTLLSGVHRRDVRNLLRGGTAATAAAAAGAAASGASPVDPGAPPPSASPSVPLSVPPPAPRSLPAEVVARWLSDPRFLDAEGAPRTLPRGASDPDAFDALVASLSLDVRPRAVLDELLRLQVAELTPDGVLLKRHGFAPRQGFEQLSQLFADNLRDHAAAASANLAGHADFLEQALFVDQLSPESVAHLRHAANAAWQQAFRTVMQPAQQRFDQDQALPAEQRTQRLRFGVYFFSDEPR